MDNVRTKKKIISFGILIYLIAYVAFYLCFLLKHYLRYAETITAANMIIITFIAFVALGYHKDKINYLKKNVMKIVIIQVLFYFCLMYAAGLALGFLKNAYSLEPLMIINNIFAPVIIVVASEILRYIFISNCKSLSKDSSNALSFVDKALIGLVTLALIIVDVSSQIRLDMFTSASRVFKITTSIFLPSIAKNLMLTYLTFHVGLRSPLIYRLVMDLYIFIVPIFPDLGEYVTAMIGIVFPFFVYQYSSREIREYEFGKDYQYNLSSVGSFKKSDLLLIGLTVILICLISGVFPLYILGIATGSMDPTISVGDAVLINKVHSDSEINEGDVIVYDRDGTKIVHRVISKKTRSDGRVIYRTKGDANNSDDKIDITIDSISGKVLLKVPYVGYPSVWASEVLN